MTQVLELAKQGDAQAINALVNRSLNPQGITAKVLCQGDQMKIRLESLDIPDKENLTKYLIQGLGKIGVAISYLEVYGKRTGQEGYAWTRAFQVEGTQFTPVAVGNAAAPTPVAGAPISDAADNPFLANAAATPAGKPRSSVRGLDQGDILAQAQDGNLEAIETIVRAALADKEDLVPLIELNGNVLKVTIETKQFLDGPAFCGEFGTKMNVLAGGVVKELEIYKRKSEKNAPFLMKKTGLFTASEAAVASAPPVLEPYSSSSSRANGQSSAMRYTESASNYRPQGSQARPTAVTWLAVVYFVFGGLGAVMGAFMILGGLAVGAAVSAQGNGAGGAAVGGVVLLFGFLILALGAGEIVVGVGLMQMRKWSRIGVIVVECMSILGTVVDMLAGKYFSFWRILCAARIIQYILSLDEALFVN
jgi:hypothetical protein